MCIVRSFNANLLVSLNPDMFTAFNYNRADAECSADSGTNCRADRSPGNRADDNARSGCRAAEAAGPLPPPVERGQWAEHPHRVRSDLPMSRVTVPSQRWRV